MPNTQKDWIKRLEAEGWIDPIPIISGQMEDIAGQSRQLHVRVHIEEGSIWATVDEFPGVFATGDDFDELRESLQEGIALVLAGPGEPVPTITLASLDSEPVAMHASSQLVFA